MRMRSIAAASLAGLLFVACDNAGNDDAGQSTPPPEQSGSAAPASGSGDRARDALGEAADSARQTMENLGEAGQAGFDALQENAPEIREGLDNAGERLRNAAGALIEDPDQPDTPGDSELDANETPEALEPPTQP